MIWHPCGHFYGLFLKGVKSETPAKTNLTLECLSKATEHKSFRTGRDGAGDREGLVAGFPISFHVSFHENLAL